MRRLSNVIAFDDGPSAADKRDAVAQVMVGAPPVAVAQVMIGAPPVAVAPVIGVLCARTRMDLVLRGEVTRDGDDATSEILRLLGDASLLESVQLIMLQGIAFAGFNVIDAQAVAAATGRPVLVVARREPNYAKMKRALLAAFDEERALAKWRLIEGLGPMEACAFPHGSAFVQRVGLSRVEASAALEATCEQGNIPAPLRYAHLIAGAFSDGRSRGRC